MGCADVIGRFYLSKLRVIVASQCYSILSPVFPLSLNLWFIIMLLGILTVRCALIDTQLQGSYSACQPQLIFSGDLSSLLAPGSSLQTSGFLPPAS